MLCSVFPGCPFVVAAKPLTALLCSLFSHSSSRSRSLRRPWVVGALIFMNRNNLTVWGNMRVCCQYLCLQQVSLPLPFSLSFFPSHPSFFVSCACQMPLATWPVCCLRPGCTRCSVSCLRFALREALVKSTRNNWQLWLPFLLTFAALLGLCFFLLPLHLLLLQLHLPFLLTFNCSFLQLPVARGLCSSDFQVVACSHCCFSYSRCCCCLFARVLHATSLSRSRSRSQSLSQHAQALSLSHPVGLGLSASCSCSCHWISSRCGCLLPLLIVT